MKPQIKFKFWLMAIFLFISSFMYAQKKEDAQSIKSILDQQATCWSNTDLDCFMQYYWASDSLRFISKNGVTYGWQNLMNRYKLTYNGAEAMGKLKFTIIHLDLWTDELAGVTGKFYLTRPEKGDLSGYFNLIFKKINGKWFIIMDHTSG